MTDNGRKNLIKPRILLELYDYTDPISNLVAVIGLQPEKVFFFGELNRLQRPCHRQMLEKGVRVFCPQTDIDYLPGNPMDIDGMIERVGEIIERYTVDQCVVDLTGGHDLCLFAMGRIFERYGIPMVAYKVGKHALINITVPNSWESMPLKYKPTIQQMFAAVGGRLIRHGHLQLDDTRMVALKYALSVMDYLRKDATRWPHMVKYLQHALKTCPSESRIYSVGMVLAAGHSTVACPVDMMIRLRDMGILSHLTMNLNELHFSFSHPALSEVMTDYGSWLELYVYKLALDSRLFDQVDTSVVVSWDNDEEPGNDIENEIDVIAIRGMGQLFISCKIGTVDQYDLYELVTLTRRFGSRYAVAVLVTMKDLRDTSPNLMIRAERLGVIVLCGKDLNRNVFMKRLNAIAQRWGTAKEIIYNGNE